MDRAINGRGYKVLQDNTLKAIEVSTSNKNVDNHYKSLQAALLVLRLCETLDSRFADNEDMKQFFDYLALVEQSAMNNSSFDSSSLNNGGTVVVVEGLRASGKTTLTKSLVEKFENIYIFRKDSIDQINKVKDIYLSMPEPIVRAFQFVVNYCLAYEVKSYGILSPNYHLLFLYILTIITF